MNRIVTLLGLVIMASVAQPADATISSPLFYEPYAVLPGIGGGLGINAGLTSADFSSIGDASDTYLMAKYSITDQLEAGMRITSGWLHDHRDSFSDVVIGVKHGLTMMSAVTAGMAVYNEHDKIGVSAGYLHAMRAGGMNINSHFQAGFMRGYAPDGVVISLNVEPRLELGDRLIGYMDVLLRTNTDHLRNNWAFDIWPNIDVLIMDSLIINGGITLGIGGKMKQQDPGIHLAALFVAPLH